ncbi:MAG: sugar phosphate isomerase/epimerase [Proteobacteria bacterium]|nr:sugar phosphate isomerase/epimerase [Pseudomonadota bacterium]MBU4288255.1 sugar phosphate isomerase/epimerase [Pseudomonadota bacterium]MBU4393394.1 sugar phosphate isomerase/epimerase [Actinomycetota bacterium]MCG2756947.1 sugar phosphate isomerase/epimerase [Desulfobacteraceae bacterium]
MKIGLKLYSTNVALIPDALRLKKEGFFDYIELYIVPGTYEETIDAWKDLGVPYVIHAPHSFHGVNLAQADKWETNLQRFNEARQFADDFGSDIIIVHGGNNGTFNETIRQISLLNEKRIVLENKPQKGLYGEICVGWSPEEFHTASHAGVLSGTALDFVHANCASNSMGVEVMKLVSEFMIFKPKIFHLSDGERVSEKDTHFNFGKGNLNLHQFVSVIPEGGLLTIETPRDQSRGFRDFIHDVRYLYNIVAHGNSKLESM